MPTLRQRIPEGFLAGLFSGMWIFAIFAQVVVLLLSVSAYSVYDWKWKFACYWFLICFICQCIISFFNVHNVNIYLEFLSFYTTEHVHGENDTLKPLMFLRVAQFVVLFLVPSVFLVLGIIRTLKNLKSRVLEAFQSDLEHPFGATAVNVQISRDRANGTVRKHVIGSIVLSVLITVMLSPWSLKKPWCFRARQESTFLPGGLRNDLNFFVTVPQVAQVPVQFQVPQVTYFV